MGELLIDTTIHQKWPTRFFVRQWSEHAAHATAIIEHLYKLKSQSTENIASKVAPKAKSSAGLYEGDFDLLETDHSGLLQLKEFILDTVRSVVSRLNGNQVPPKSIQTKIVDAWYHITNDGGFHDAHGHPNCSWCGIYYLQLGDSLKSSPNAGETGAPNGANRFYLPHTLGGSYQDYGNQYLNVGYLDPPIEDGMLLLFPSYLWHSALPYSGEKDRIVIAFNSQSAVEK